MKNTFRFLFVMFCLFTATNPLHAQWIQTNGPYGGYVACFAVSPNGAGGTNLFAGNGDGVYLSSNNGTSWTAVNTGLTNTYVNALAVSPNGTGGMNLFAGTADDVFLSTNNGTSWTAVNNGLPTGTSVTAFAVSGTNLFAGGPGIFRSTNNGTSWTAVNTGSTNEVCLAFAVSGTNLFAGTGGGVFLSSNNGTSWTLVNYYLTVSAFAFSTDVAGGTNLFAGSGYGDGVFLSTDNGTSWTAVNTGLTNTSVRCLAVSPNGAGGTNLFAGTQGGGVFLSINNGSSWTAVNTGLNSTVVFALAVSGTNLFAGTEDGAWRRPLSELVTSVKKFSTDLPTHFDLEQNYPNPFNPSTSIQYDLPVPGHVNLVVYNALGQIVVKLVDEQQNAGSYKVSWDGSGVASGMYFCRLQTGEFVETKKMLVVK